MKKLFSAIVMITFLCASGSSVANTALANSMPAVQQSEEVDLPKIKVVISIVVKKKTSRGVIAEISGFKLRNGDRLKKK